MSPDTRLRDDAVYRQVIDGIRRAVRKQTEVAMLGTEASRVFPSPVDISADKVLHIEMMGPLIKEIIRARGLDPSTIFVVQGCQSTGLLACCNK